MRREARQCPDIFDKLMMLPYILVPPDEQRAMFREAKERAEAAEQKRVLGKVETWLQDAHSLPVGKI
jgi:hypothetical protein